MIPNLLLHRLQGFFSGHGSNLVSRAGPEAESAQPRVRASPPARDHDDPNGSRAAGFFILILYSTPIIVKLNNPRSLGYPGLRQRIFGPLPTRGGLYKLVKL